jgi:5'-nucleotidase
VDIILLSRNSPDLSLRAFYSFEQHGLAISRGSFTGGRSVASFARAWGVDLFLSNEDEDVKAAVAASEINCERTSGHLSSQRQRSLSLSP